MIVMFIKKECTVEGLRFLTAKKQEFYDYL